MHRGREEGCRAGFRSPIQGSRILIGIVDSQAWQPGLRIGRPVGAECIGEGKRDAGQDLGRPVGAECIGEGKRDAGMQGVFDERPVQSAFTRYPAW